ncbi:hypothetical protein K4L44_04060 [Halosquirtibacter laminarini]|uniref:Uncharacterized protein n=1 Tax=Halosquirtibacter laminarini TaxID=3374600 RepID=A0AC61NH87_9BACT|nr:hypothetical protein K4L44_04060 [Prolixibacteraceae bacterium]
MDNLNQTISFALAKITTEQFAIIENDLSLDSLNLESNFRFAADKEKKMVGVFAKFSFSSDQNPFMIIECGCHFRIQPDAWEKLLSKEENSITFPKSIIQHLTVITVGTTRGVLHAKTENTKYNHLFLPTINLQEMITDDHKFTF